jgi:hypothetical protein
MRVAPVLALVLALVAGCDASHEADRDAAAPIDAGSDAGDDAAIVGDAAGAFAVALGPSTFTTCACHHGCAPGIDGTLTLDVTNASTSAHAITITRVTVDSVGSPGGPYVTGSNGWFHVTGAAADGSVVVAAGAMTAIEVTVYLDIPIVEPGTDSIVVDATIDGASATFDLGTTSVTTAPGC